MCKSTLRFLCLCLIISPQNQNKLFIEDKRFTNTLYISRKSVINSRSSTCSPSFTLTPPSPYRQAVWVNAILQAGPLPRGGALLSRGTDYVGPCDVVLTPTGTGKCGTGGQLPSEHGRDARWSPKHAYTNIIHM